MKGKLFNPVDHVYRPHVNINIDGEGYACSGLALVITASGIPQATISIDPFNTWSDSMSKANAPGVATFIDKYKFFQELIRDKERRKIDITFRNGTDRYAGSDDPQDFDLKGWLVLSAGFVGVHSQGGFSFRIEAVHPLYAFQESTAHLVGSGEDGVIPRYEIYGDNVYEALISGMEAYQRRHKPDALVTPAAADKSFSGMAGMKDIQDTVCSDYAEMVKTLKEHLVWDKDWTGSGFPDAPFTHFGMSTHIPYGVLEYIKSMNNAGSWDWLVHMFCAHWFLVIVPTYWENALRMKPLETWQRFRATIYDTDCTSIDLPAVDPAPARGVMGLFDASGLTGYAEYSLFPEGAAKTRIEAVSMLVEGLTGRILSLGIPGWLKNLAQDDQASNATLAAAGKDTLESGEYGASNNVYDIKGGTGSVRATALDDLINPDDGVLKNVAKELFLENYRLHYQIAIRGRLMVRNKSATTPDKFIVPGYVMRLAGNPDLPGATIGTDLLDFYVTKVAHIIDCQNGTAYTEIAGAFVHDVGGPTLKDLDGNTVMQAGIGTNPMYASSAAAAPGPAGLSGSVILTA